MNIVFDNIVLISHEEIPMHEILNCWAGIWSLTTFFDISEIIKMKF